MRAYSLLIILSMLLSACYEAPVRGEYASGPADGPKRPVGLNLNFTAADLPEGRQGLTFGVAPFLGNEKAQLAYRPLARYLSRVLGVPVELVVGSSYQDLIDKVVGNAIDVAILPPASYVLAKQRAPKLQLLASQIAYGATSYSSYILVRADDSAQTLGDLADRRMAFVDKRSTSGYLFPYAAFLNAGVDPTTAFSGIVYAGEHLRTIRLLLKDQVDAAATASGMMNVSRRDYKSGLDAASTRILVNAGRIPYDALCAGAQLPASGARKLAWAFIGVSTRTSLGRRNRPFRVVP